MGSIHHCEESCLDFGLTAWGATFKVLCEIRREPSCRGGEEREWGCREVGGFLSPALLARLFLEVLLEDSED